MSNTARPKDQQNPDDTKPNHQASVIEPSGVTSGNVKTYNSPDGTDGSDGDLGVEFFRRKWKVSTTWAFSIFKQKH